MTFLGIFNLKKAPRNLHEYMKINNLSRQEIAEILEISESYLSYLLNGKRNLSRKKAIRASLITGIPLKNLIQ